MTKFGLIGPVALSLALVATPVMAMHVHHHYGYLLKYHYGSTYAAYNLYRGYDFARRNTFN